MAGEFVKTKRAIGMHYDTFPMIEIDKDAAVHEFRERGVKLLLPAIGETVEI